FDVKQQGIQILSRVGSRRSILPKAPMFAHFVSRTRLIFRRVTSMIALCRKPLAQGQDARPPIPAGEHFRPLKKCAEGTAFALPLHQRVQAARTLDARPHPTFFARARMSTRQPRSDLPTSAIDSAEIA